MGGFGQEDGSFFGLDLCGQREMTHARDRPRRVL